MGKESNKKIYIFISSIILILFAILLSYNVFFKKTQVLTRVSKILNVKYDNIQCIDEKCNGVISIKGNEVILIDKNGDKIAKYDNNDNYIPYEISDKYFISRKTDENDLIGYSINDNNGNITYESKNKLDILNKNYVLMSDNNKYTILDINGNKKISNIEEIQSYLDGRYILVKENGKYTMYDEKLKKILDEYIIDLEVKDNEKTIYYIVKNIKTNQYNYFNIKKSKIVGDNFESYVRLNDDSNLLITKREKNKNVKYILDEKGKQKKQNNSKLQVQIVKDIKSKLDKDFYLYTESVIDENQKYVIVDNKKENSIGAYNINTKKFYEIYSYSSKYSNVYSSVSNLNANNDLFFQISCTSNSCDTPVTVIYNLTKNKEMYINYATDKIPEKYIQYDNNYKVIKYSYSSNNNDYKGKYVLYNDKNEELLKDDNDIYSSKKNSKLNEKPGEIININNSKVYKYNNEENETVLLNSSGDTIISTTNKIVYGKQSIMVINNNTIDIYNIPTNEKIEYKLKENESIYSLNSINLQKDSIYINNYKDNYVKIVNQYGNELKVIKNVQFKEISENDSNNVFMIVKDKNDKYGLYIGK